MNVSNLIKNGLYLPFLSFFIYLISDDIYFSVFFFLKAFSINYYQNFSYLYPQPHIYKWRHMIRLTDTGHLAAFMFYFNKKTTALAHNIHFIIDVGYYITKFAFNMSDTDNVKKNNELYLLPQKLHEYTNHCLTYFLIVYHILSTKERDFQFDNYSLIYTIIWLYSWLFFIYVPWVLITNDYVYNILEPSNPIYLRLGIIFFINILAYLSNNFGKLLLLI